MTEKSGKVVISDELSEKQKELKVNLQALGSVAVCFSGGVDSSFLLAFAHEVLGDRVIAVDNTEVTSVSDLKAILSEHAVGDTLSFELERDGRTGTIDLTLEEYSPAATA